jgi:hypothetical protein
MTLVFHTNRKSPKCPQSSENYLWLRGGGYFESRRVVNLLTDWVIAYNTLWYLVAARRWHYNRFGSTCPTNSNAVTNFGEGGLASAENRTERMLQQHRSGLRIPVTLHCYVAAECSNLDAQLHCIKVHLSVSYAQDYKAIYQLLRYFACTNMSRNIAFCV